AEIELCAGDPAQLDRVLVVVAEDGSFALVRAGATFDETIGIRVWNAIDDELLTDPRTLVAALRALTATATDATIVDPLGCSRLVWDPQQHLDDPRAVESAALAVLGRGTDLRVRVEGGTDGDIDRRLEQLERDCPGWTVDGDRP